MASFPGQKSTGSPLPNPPLSLAVTGSTTSTVSLSWSAPLGGATSYNLYRNNVKVQTGLAGTTATDTGLSPTTAYTYYVTAQKTIGEGSRSNQTTGTTTGAVPNAPTGLAVTGTTSSSVSLSWTAPVGGATTYNLYRNGSKVQTGIVGTTTTDTGLTASTSYTYNVSGSNAFGEGAQSSSVTGTTSASSGMIISVPGFKAQVGFPGGTFSSTASALSAWKSDATGVDNLNSSKIFNGLEVCVNYPLIFPTTNGNWSASQGIDLFLQMFAFMDTLKNGPYTLSVQCNANGNTFGTNVSDAKARAYTPSWWYDNATYGPTGGNNTTGGPHGGVYWNTSQGISLLFWNPPCLNDIASCWGAIYQAIESAGRHIHRVDFIMELTAAAASISGGYTDAKMQANFANVFAPQMRALMPTSKLECKAVYSPQIANQPAFQQSLFAAKWSGGNYDNCNETVPSDLTTAQGNAWAFPGDLAFRGQATVNGPVVSTNFKALGNDRICYASGDEFGNRTVTAAVPPAHKGSGRIIDGLLHAQQLNASEVVFEYEFFQGPRCNVWGTYSGQPANYNYPQTGPQVTAANLPALLVQLNANQYLNFNYPAAW